METEVNCFHVLIKNTSFCLKVQGQKQDHEKPFYPYLRPVRLCVAVIGGRPTAGGMPRLFLSDRATKISRNLHRKVENGQEPMVCCTFIFMPGGSYA
jgi:hypothetical protein